jgi:asparagine synthase (glutamine-hydrolysing)
MRLRGGTGKWLMKKSLERYLPRRDPLPPQDGLRDADQRLVPRARSPTRPPAIARSPALAELGWFDEAAIARLAADHRSGRADHGRLLWQLLMLEKSLQRLFGLGVAPRTRASTKYSPSGGALKPSAARSRA